MKSSTTLLSRPNPALAGRQWLRVDLTSGDPVARCLDPLPGATIAETLDRACDFARRTRMMCSIPAPGPIKDLPGHVAEALARAGLPPDRIELGITTASVQRGDLDALLALSALCDLGVGVLLGDVETHDIEALGRLPLSSVMIAENLIRALPHTTSAIEGVRRLARITETLALALIAPAVETEIQRAMLSGIGCHQGEGDLFGH